MTAFKTTTASPSFFKLLLLKYPHLSIVLFTFHVYVLSTNLHLHCFWFIFHFAVVKTSFCSGCKNFLTLCLFYFVFEDAVCLISQYNTVEKKIRQVPRIFMSSKAYIILKLLTKVSLTGNLGFSFVTSFLQFTVLWGNMWKYDTMLETNWMWLRSGDIHEQTVQDQLFYCQVQ